MITSKRIVAGTLAVGTAAIAGTVATEDAASAHVIQMHDAFPSHGYIWLQVGLDSAILFVASEQCYSEEQTAWTRIKDDTKDAPEFLGYWSNGLSVVNLNCSGSVNNSVDILLDYMTDSEWTAAGHGNYGGHVHSSLAPASWCNTFYGSSPCGIHYSRIHIKKSRFTGYSSSFKPTFFVHESGHSFGFYDDCSQDESIARNCNPYTPHWTSLDRKEMKMHIYPTPDNPPPTP